MTLSEARFNELVDATQQKLVNLFDQSRLDLTSEQTAGVLTVKFGNGDTWVFDRMTPLRQMWLADRSGPFHFHYSEERDEWVCEQTNERLGEVLQRIVVERGGEKHDFDKV
ncbi:iron donor protein CyaY [Streptomyces sp. YS415]|uniref:iron donor protein CyaY n=1 Tax=Streptomyces sp. YS415 TaxID=2944806 RepID=UPI00202120DA|nr:iron donor protein CyaY [Streptomyces sp. YS415]MCL7430391.1 iron donor protein CyaY [Streptomyces sp. YS415]